MSIARHLLDVIEARKPTDDPIEKRIISLVDKIKDKIDSKTPRDASEKFKHMLSSAFTEAFNITAETFMDQTYPDEVYIKFTFKIGDGRYSGEWYINRDKVSVTKVRDVL